MLILLYNKYYCYSYITLYNNNFLYIFFVNFEIRGGEFTKTNFSLIMVVEFSEFGIVKKIPKYFWKIVFLREFSQNKARLSCWQFNNSILSPTNRIISFALAYRL